MIHLYKIFIHVYLSIKNCKENYSPKHRHWISGGIFLPSIVYPYFSVLFQFFKIKSMLSSLQEQ